MEPVSDDENRPLWQQVLDDLERRLAAGEIVDRFPTDRELCEHYGVSRHTVREAVRRLRARGLVERHRGRGSFVNDARLVQPLGGLYSLFDAVERQGLPQRSDVLFLGVERDAAAAARLDLPSDADLVRLQRLRHAGDEPLALDSVWLPADLGRPLLEVDFSRTALYEELRERTGVRIDAAEEFLEPLVPDADARDVLHLGPDEALLRVRRLGSSGGRPVECRISLLRGQRFVYTSAWADDTIPATSFTPST